MACNTLENTKRRFKELGLIDNPTHQVSAENYSEVERLIKIYQQKAEEVYGVTDNLFELKTKTTPDATGKSDLTLHNLEYNAEAFKKMDEAVEEFNDNLAFEEDLARFAAESTSRNEQGNQYFDEEGNVYATADDVADALNEEEEFFNSMIGNTNNVNQQLQSINLGQTLTNNATNRAMQNWTGAMAPTTAMSNQLGQSGQFGSYDTGNKQFNTNMLNQANQAQAGLQMSGVNSLFGSPAFNTQGQQTPSGGLVNQGINWLGNNTGTVGNTVGNWLGGNTGTGYNTDQYNNLISQQDGFNWSGISDVSAGSAQDMMLNDQWDWSW